MSVSSLPTASLSTPRAALLTLTLAAICSTVNAADWRQFRGTDGTGVAAGAKLPISWSETENVAWQVALPGRGPSSPIVVGDRVIVTASDGPRQDRLLVLCHAAADGRELWRREFWATGRTLSHPQSGTAAPTPASDGSRIFAFYSSNDLVCLDLDGNLQWYRGLTHDYPKAGNDVGMSSSPIVVDGAVIVQVENQGDSFAAAIEAETGEERWRVPRSPLANWVSPTELPLSDGNPGEGKSGKSLVLLQSPAELTAHDPRTGETIWKYEAPCGSIPSPVAARGRVYFAAKGITALAIDPASHSPSRLWDSNQLNPNSASPVLHGDRLYVMSRGVLNAADVETGKKLWQLRIPGTYWATPSLAGEHLYCFSFEGDATVVKVGETGGEIVAKIPMGEAIQGSPAIAGNSLYVRSDKHLWKIGQ